MHVVIVTTDDFQAEVLAGAARRRGMSAQVTATTGVSGVAAPDAIIIDCEVPDAHTLDELRAAAVLAPSAAVILLVEHIPNEAHRDLARLNVSHVRLKPFHPPELLTLLGQATAADVAMPAEAGPGVRNTGGRRYAPKRAEAG